MLSLVLLLILVVPVFSIDSNGNTPNEEEVKVTSSYQLIPLTEDVGAGSVRVKIKGEAAVEFRHALLDSIDRGDNALEKDELRLYLGEGGMLRSYIQRGNELEKFRNSLFFSKYGFRPKRDIDRDEKLRYQGLEIDSVKLPHRDIKKDTKGLVNTSYDDSSSIQIDLQLSFEGEKKLKRRAITPSDTGLISSLWDSLLIPVNLGYIENLTEEEKTVLERGIELPHGNLLVEGDRVQGVVIKNGERMDRENYSFERDGQVTVHDNLSVGDRVRFYYGYGVNWSLSSEVTHWNFVLGTDSFRPKSRENGDLFMLRTPGGNVLRYEYRFDGEEDDRGLMWDGFNVLDNPQILFFLVALLAYTSLKALSHNYEKYRVEPSDEWGKIRWLHVGSKLSCLSLFILYFIPVIGPLFIGGLHLILISTTVSISIIGLSEAAYGRKRSVVLKELYEPKEKEFLNKKLLKRSDKKKELKKMRCRYCEEEFRVSVKRSPLTVLCPNCGKRIRRLKVGRNHLLIADDKKRWGIYSLFIQFLSEGVPGLILSTHEPMDIEKTFRVNRELVVKVVEREDEDGGIALSELSGIGVGLVERFAEDYEEGVILVEGLGDIYDDFGELEKFLDELLGRLEGKDTTLLIQVDPEKVSDDVLKRIKEKVDRWETL